MDNTLRIVPSSSQASTAVASVKDTSNELGVHDAMRYGPRSLAADIKDLTPLQGRLENWEATQDNLKLNLQRNMYGLHAPIKLLMERKAVAHNPHMPPLPRSNIHLDILMGRDEMLDAPDVMGGAAETGPTMDIHAEMEKKLRV